ncbi:MAG TPA: pilin [Candidatus Paceibacterota bacterium]|nr:pilin [Candidatus Paceibacterota bacterium]
MKKYLFLGLIITSLIIPTIVSAGDLKGPLVPCGTSTTEPCTFCHLFVLAQTIIDFITTGIFILAVLFIVIGGLIILFAGAVPSNLELGKKIITNAVIGVVIALLAWTVINMIFNTLISTDENKFPAPWNDIKCQGGEVTPPTGKNLYCHIIQNEGDAAKMVEYYFSEIFCQTECDSEHCAGNPPLKNCFKWCCLDKDKSGLDFACEGGSPTGQWCQRLAPSGSDIWKLGNISPKQKGDASFALTSFINCMYGKIPGLIITSISEDALCVNPSCDTTKEKCGAHVINSCHYGGSGCTGSSYAVDFATNIQCSDIKTAASYCNPKAWINWENNHTHVSVDNSWCLCAEKGTGNPCP